MGSRMTTRERSGHFFAYLLALSAMAWAAVIGFVLAVLSLVG
jgi:hypothetical protein